MLLRAHFCWTLRKGLLCFSYFTIFCGFYRQRHKNGLVKLTAAVNFTKNSCEVLLVHLCNLLFDQLRIYGLLLTDALLWWHPCSFSLYILLRFPFNLHIFLRMCTQEQLTAATILTWLRPPRSRNSPITEPSKAFYQVHFLCTAKKSTKRGGIRLESPRSPPYYFIGSYLWCYEFVILFYRLIIWNLCRSNGLLSVFISPLSVMIV